MSKAVVMLRISVIYFLVHNVICRQSKKIKMDPVDLNLEFNFDNKEAAPALPSRRNYRDEMERVDGLRIRMDPASEKLLRIRGGNLTDTRNFPYMAAVIINGRLWCAGAIVDVNWVVTAAHCLNYVLHVSPMKSLQKYVKVRVGSPRPHEGGILVDVAGAVRHPKFEEEPVPHADVALLKLVQDLIFDERVNLIKIYEGMKEPYAQSFVVITGWGATKGSETAFRDQTPDLLTARLKVRTQHYCMDAYQLVNGFMFTEDFFCASLRNGTRDACLFDAGAPAVQQNRLMGIMSFGPERCGHSYQPAVFVKAFYFRDFVKSTISQYKTTKDLIEAMKAVEPAIKPPVHITRAVGEGLKKAENSNYLYARAPYDVLHHTCEVHQPTDNPEQFNEDEVTQPDSRHDKK